MKCCLKQHFIWVFTVCQSTFLSVTQNEILASLSTKGIRAISHIRRNGTEKIKCLKTYECFHIYAKTEYRTENVHELDFIFSISTAEFQQIWEAILITPAYTQPHALYLT